MGPRALAPGGQIWKDARGPRRLWRPGQVSRDHACFSWFGDRRSRVCEAPPHTQTASPQCPLAWPLQGARAGTGVPPLSAGHLPAGPTLLTSCHPRHLPRPCLHPHTGSGLRLIDLGTQAFSPHEGTFRGSRNVFPHDGDAGNTAGSTCQNWSGWTVLITGGNYTSKPTE